MQNKMTSIKDLIQTTALPFFVKQASTDTVIDLDMDMRSLKITGWVPKVVHFVLLGPCVFSFFRGL